MSVSTMKKLTVFSSEKDADAILRRLMNLRCVEIEPTNCSREELPLQRLRCAGDDGDLAEKLERLQTAITALTPYATRRKRSGLSRSRVNREEFYSSGRADAAWETVEEYFVLAASIEALEERRRTMQRQREALSPWMEYDLPLEERETAQTKVLLGCFPLGTLRETLTEAFEGLDAFVEFVLEDKTSLYAAVTLHRREEERVNAILAMRGFVRVTLEEIEEGTAEENFYRAEEALENLAVELRQEKDKLYIPAEHLGDVEILWDLLRTDQLTAMHRRKLALSQTCTVLEGWCPTFTQDAVEAALDKLPCAYELSDPQENEEPPVLLRNNRFAVNFEWVIGMYSYPKYGRFDPTFIMSIFYFIIFGLMFADVGYGLLLVIACFGGARLLHPKPGLRRMMYMFGYCGISCMIQGVLFGGWLGDLPTAIMTNLLHVSVDNGVGHFFGSGLWFNPLDDPMTFLILSLAVGAVHLIAGMAVQLYGLCKDGKPLEGICTIVPYWVLFAGIALLVLLPSVGLYVTVAGAALILVFNGYGVKKPVARIIKGLGGLYGLINYASDLLSYSRILALGLVAGVIAKVVNMITMMGNSVGGFIVMLIVMIAGHLLNLALNLLGAFVHTSRLQYLEFFGKFYEDGGRPFEPALPSEEYSEEME